MSLPASQPAQSTSKSRSFLFEKEDSKFKVACVLSSSAAKENTGRFTWVQQAIYSLSLTIHLNFVRFITFFKSGLGVAEKIRELKTIYESKRGGVEHSNDVSTSFDEMLASDPAVCDALKELEIRWLSETVESVDIEFKSLKEKIEKIEVPNSSPRASQERKNTLVQQGMNKSLVDSIPDLINEMLSILKSVTSQPSSLQNK